MIVFIVYLLLHSPLVNEILFIFKVLIAIPALIPGGRKMTNHLRRSGPEYETLGDLKFRNPSQMLTVDVSGIRS